MNIKNTVNKEEIDKFSKLADEWWDPSGKFAPLHKFNPIRQEYIINEISKNFDINIDNPSSLEKLKILDVGCGGGLLCEPLAGFERKLQEHRNCKLCAKRNININIFVLARKSK